MKQPSSGDVSIRLADLAQLAEACRDAYLAVSAESHWRPAPGSPASAAQTLIDQKDAASSADGIMSGFNLVSEVIVTYLEIAAGHFGGLAALYLADEAMFPPAPLVRSVMEHSAHAMWIIGDNTRPPADMLARAYLEEFTSCEFAKMAAGRMGSKEDEIYKKAEVRWYTVRERAIAAFPGTTLNDLSESKPGRTISEQMLPGPEACVAGMFDLLYKEVGGTVTERQARGIYAFLSSGTHPSLYQARQMRTLTNHGDHHGTLLSVDVGSLERLLAAAVVTFSSALSYTMSFYGLDRTAHEDLEDKIDTVLPGYLTSSER